MKRILVLASVILLAACQSSPPPPVAPAPPVVGGPIVAPGPDVMPELAAFQGIWVGKWDGTVDARIAIDTVAGNGAITGTYTSGGSANSKPGSKAFTGFITTKVATITLDADTDVTLTMQPDGTLAGTYFGNDATSKGTFRKF